MTNEEFETGLSMLEQMFTNCDFAGVNSDELFAEIRKRTERSEGRLMAQYEQLKGLDAVYEYLLALESENLSPLIRTAFIIGYKQGKKMR